MTEEKVLSYNDIDLIQVIADNGRVNFKVKHKLRTFVDPYIMILPTNKEKTYKFEVNIPSATISSFQSLNIFKEDVAYIMHFIKVCSAWFLDNGYILEK